MQIFVTGGTGFVGTNLVQYLHEKGHGLTVLTRNRERAGHLTGKANILEADPIKAGPWQQEMAKHQVIINLAGASIFSRWTAKNKNIIRQSRLATTENIVEGLKRDGGEVGLLLSTSAVGYYGFRGDVELDENAPAGDDFLASLAREWEATALKARELGVRVVLLRFGIILGRNGGALRKMLRPFKFGLGFPLGSGKQWFPWIHERDLARIYEYVIENKEIDGPVNCTAPNPVTNLEFTRALGKALNRPVFLPSVPGFLIKAILGEFGSILLEGQKAIPNKLLDKGFVFDFSTVSEALNDLLQSV